MRPDILQIIIYSIALLINNIPSGNSHIPIHVSTPSSKAEQFCQMSENCVHDTIAICGAMGDKKRTFLDLCDLMEYACDTNQIYTHVENEKGCPPGGDAK